MALAGSIHAGNVGSAFVALVPGLLLSSSPPLRLQTALYHHSNFATTKGLTWHLTSKTGFHEQSHRTFDNPLRGRQCIDVSSRQRVDRVETS